jgi:hypothetical protein
MDLIADGIKQKLVRLEDDGKYIVYVHQVKRRNYTNREKQVQALAFLSLVLTCQYLAKRVRQFVPVQMVSVTKKSDIIVYDDDELKNPFILALSKSNELRI